MGEKKERKPQRLSEQALKNKRMYTAKWVRENTVSITVQLSKLKDQMIIDFLANVPNKNKYIKDLLRKALTK